MSPDSVGAARAPRLELRVLAGRHAVCRLGSESALDAALALLGSASVGREGGGLVVVARTPDELSLVCPDELRPIEVEAETGFRALAVRGPLDFALVGILAALTGALAEAGVSVFAVSTYDTDYLLVREGALERAVTALRSAGHRIDG